MKKRSTLAVLGLILASASAQAIEVPKNAYQFDHPGVETTIVTASRTEQAIADSLAPVTVFEKEDIERIRPVDLQELLSRAVGVNFVRNGGRGASSSLFLRGNQSNHTLVLVDGVRTGSATLGSPSLNNLPPELIERIEIVRGPRSALYGSEAIGGVINIITKKYHDSDGIKPLLQAAVGENGTVKSVAALSGGSERAQFNIALLHEDTDGIDHTASKADVHGDDDGFEQDAVNASFSYRINEGNRIDGLYQRSEAESDYDGSCFGTGFVQYSCAPYNDTGVEVANLRAILTPLENWLLTLSAGESKDESQVDYRFLDPAAIGVIGDHFDTRRRTLALQNDWTLGKHHIISAGYERLDDEVDSTQAYDVDSRSNDALFAQWQAELGKIDLALGWRNDDNEQFGVADTRNASAGYNFSDSLKLVFSYGEGFNAPTFNDLYYPFYGVPTLEPETSRNRELGLRGDAVWGGWSINAFQNDVEKLIQYNPATFGPDQIDSAQIRGVEITAATEIFGWHIDANASFLDPIDRETGEDLRRRPRRQVNVDIDRQWGNWGLSAGLRAVGSRYEDTANTDRLAGYALVDGSLSYFINPALRLQLSMKNLFDKDYVSARSFSLGDYQSVGREALLSVTYAPQ